MTDPKETNEELSTDDLKSVRGGIVIRGNDCMLKGNGPEGSGSGKTLKEWEKGNKTEVVVDNPSFDSTISR
ncbi:MULTISPECIES: hypothetical protein [Prochlorococcus]|uniref:hypothetical protein n=1 Tax=Prochlorococcus TaxID=1218 RepID=UPI0007B3C8E6|nr:MULTISPECIES: hypothetical protein [Prochlorococcus]KZR66946.1 hypothetical protein PMIT1312_00729 [Prochlorococcus marinus str. MIT 1312]KZR81526.1 hypothetical protein PMIT1327_01036 [Prochlorococcus marinus str. MIT 1327]NMO83376.1 hypothetical protein [Prochlorococcus sp. P1344]NMP05756.1 hypothetical protein [Prochlorococcus sp. P1361]NMP13444.1 hypothetical protein [Prochlorococcus sp.P1363]